MYKRQDCDTEIENEQEEHHAKTVDDLWNGKVVIVVILNLCFYNILDVYKRQGFHKFVW